MNKSDWEKLEDMLSNPGGAARLYVDGYDVLLLVMPYKRLRYTIVIVVDGHSFVCDDPEILRRFYCPRRRLLVDKKYARRHERAMGRPAPSYTYHVPTWMSFRRLQRHLEQNNTVIEFKTEGRQQTAVA